MTADPNPTQPLNLTAAAQVVVRAWEDYQDALAETDPDKAWTRPAMRRILTPALAVWCALTGLENTADAIASARQVAATRPPVTAHVAPF